MPDAAKKGSIVIHNLQILITHKYHVGSQPYQSLPPPGVS